MNVKGSLHFTCMLREHMDGDFSVRVVVGMFKSREVAVAFSEWVRDLLQENNDEIEPFIERNDEETAESGKPN